jgi:hypothetical protein
MHTCNSTKPIAELFNKSFHLFVLEQFQKITSGHQWEKNYWQFNLVEQSIPSWWNQLRTAWCCRKTLSSDSGWIICQVYREVNYRLDCFLLAKWGKKTLFIWPEITQDSNQYNLLEVYQNLPFLDNSWKKSLARFEIRSSSSSNRIANTFI